MSSSELVFATNNFLRLSSEFPEVVSVSQLEALP